MKKILCFIIIIISFFIYSCDGTELSEVRDESSQSSNYEIEEDIQVKHIIDKIDSINDVSLDDKELIEQINEEYNALTVEQKESVTNYDIFINAKKEYQLLKNNEAKELFITKNERFTALSLIAFDNYFKDSSPKIIQYCYDKNSLSEHYLYVEFTLNNDDKSSLAFITDDSAFDHQKDYLTSLNIVTKEDLDSINIQFPIEKEMFVLKNFDGVDENHVSDLLNKYNNDYDLEYLNYKDKKTTANSENSTNNTETVTSIINDKTTNNTTKITTEKQYNICEVCGNAASYTYLNPFSNESEYYCYEHYKEIMDMKEYMLQNID